MANRKPSRRARPTTIGDWRNVLLEIEDGIAWVTLNRPEKRNAMSPALNDEMVQVVPTRSSSRTMPAFSCAWAGAGC